MLSHNLAKLLEEQLQITRYQEASGNHAECNHSRARFLAGGPWLAGAAGCLRSIT